MTHRVAAQVDDEICACDVMFFVPGRRLHSATDRRSEVRPVHAVIVEKSPVHASQEEEGEGPSDQHEAH